MWQVATETESCALVSQPLIDRHEDEDPPVDDDHHHHHHYHRESRSWSRDLRLVFGSNPALVIRRITCAWALQKFLIFFGELQLSLPLSLPQLLLSIASYVNEFHCLHNAPFGFSCCCFSSYFFFFLVCFAFFFLQLFSLLRQMTVTPSSKRKVNTCQMTIITATDSRQLQFINAHTHTHTIHTHTCTVIQAYMPAYIASTARIYSFLFSAKANFNTRLGLSLE